MVMAQFRSAVTGSSDLNRLWYVYCEYEINVEDL